MNIYKLPTNYTWDVIRLNGKTPTEWFNAQTVKPDVMFSGSFVDWTAEKGNVPLGTIIEDGVTAHDDGMGYGMGVTQDGKLGFGSPWSQKWKEFFTGFTGSVINGVYVAPSWSDPAFNSQPNRIGFAMDINGDAYVVMHDAGSTIEQFSKDAVESGMISLSNHDGGGSRYLFLNGKWYDQSSRDYLYNAVVGYSNEETPEEEETPVEKSKIVCLDPGHGVETPGKCAPDGSYYEHEFNLDVAFKIKAQLERHGVKVIMTRYDEHELVVSPSGVADNNASLNMRCRIANDSKADYFLSIHTNAAGNDGWYEAEGLSCHIIGTGGNAEKLATKIRKYVCPLVDCNDRGTHVSNYAVVRDTDMPAVLVEHGFHTDKSELEKLKSQEYRKLYAEGDAKALLEQLGIEWIPEEVPPVPEPTEWYTEAQEWVIKTGISDGTRPLDTATRAEVWEMLRRYFEKF